ncbi:MULTISPECIES: BrnT family toxin [unclassified Undibacterium]|uniref:BrnT family toxin n=1 Tax=unclassified Undibacterium TaxID=2630295 RepID=UPI002AC9023D|nr:MULTISPECIES: BrnT family toxin [unclassified Undibacterium]MEB0138890.1 BrnT family toxin [Undibacterium sp. CCC2.1]MEB0174092.1 BrnT family toxin [Undibacterium sp. CCC1.1]MEB0178052.1 BrnT family toxin [Undibacterium sp. CCC3.4]MEB0217252.1 BrnT family toxin [Undibacterium sp. 5I2]WPX44724.1 BrnT family toxin [Undibacterium sp. CCC3.4]
MKLEWNADKAARNLNKHGISFEDAELVFYDTRRIEVYDGREDYGEDRWVTIGLAYSAVLYVVYTVRHAETIRLISARKANADERKKYRETHS